MRKEVGSTTRKRAPRFPGNNIRLMLDRRDYNTLIKRFQNLKVFFSNNVTEAVYNTIQYWSIFVMHLLLSCYYTCFKIHVVCFSILSADISIVIVIIIKRTVKSTLAITIIYQIRNKSRASMNCQREYERCKP